MGSSIKQGKVARTRSKGVFLRVLLVIMVLFVGGMGIHMSLLLNQKFGPGRITDKRIFVREMLMESVLKNDRDG